MPPPLEDSPKCPRCSLVGICLPDEVQLPAQRRAESPATARGRRATRRCRCTCRRAARACAKNGETLEIDGRRQAVETVRLIDVSQVVLHGQCLRHHAHAARADAPRHPGHLALLGGWFSGIPSAPDTRTSRCAPRSTARASTRRSACASRRGLVRPRSRTAARCCAATGKPRTSPTRWSSRSSGTPTRRRGPRPAGTPRHRGRRRGPLLRVFRRMLIKRDADSASFAFDFTQRNRRPPTDPVNAMLSYRLRHPGADLDRHAHGRRLRPVPWLLPPAPLRSPRARARHDGAVSPADRGLRRLLGHQQRRGAPDGLHLRRRQRGAHERRSQAVHRCIRAAPVARKSRIRYSATESVTAGCWSCRRVCSGVTFSGTSRISRTSPRVEQRRPMRTSKSLQMAGRKSELTRDRLASMRFLPRARPALTRGRKGFSRRPDAEG